MPSAWQRTFALRFGGPFWIAFGPVRILEFYASTEGNVWLYNVEGKDWFNRSRPLPYLARCDPIALARFDLETQMPRAWGRQRILRALRRRRNRRGVGTHRRRSWRAIRRATANQPRRQRKFSATYLRTGTRMRTGDLICRDANGLSYLTDGSGDTFRWKGENVATLEVSSVIRECPGVKEAIVYGVVVAGCRRPRWHGADDDRREFGFRRLHRPPCSFALSIRGAALLCASPRARFETTETFKLKRLIYVAQGCDPARIEDPLYVLDNERQVYVLL